jgi:hypothetical protein
VKPSELLTQARDLIADENNWTTVFYARGEDGEPLDTGFDPRAVRFCAVGACDRTRASEAWLRRAAKELFPTMSGPASVNDRLGHAAAMQMFDRAIEIATAEESAEVSS